MHELPLIRGSGLHDRRSPIDDGNTSGTGASSMGYGLFWRTARKRSALRSEPASRAQNTAQSSTRSCDETSPFQGSAIAPFAALQHAPMMPHTIPTASHWGAFSASVQDGRITTIRPFANDPDPSPIIYGTPDAVHGRTRIDRPYVRKAWLNGDRAGGSPRGQDPFVPVDWDTATRLVADEIARVRDEHGPASIFGGSYGWSSAGRFHHAKTQLQRLLSAAGGFTDKPDELLLRRRPGADAACHRRHGGGRRRHRRLARDRRQRPDHAVFRRDPAAQRADHQRRRRPARHGPLAEAHGGGGGAAGQHLTDAQRHAGRCAGRVAADPPGHRHRPDAGAGPCADHRRACRGGVPGSLHASATTACARMCSAQPDGIAEDAGLGGGRSPASRPPGSYSLARDIAAHAHHADRDLVAAARATMASSRSGC